MPGATRGRTPGRPSPAGRTVGAVVTRGESSGRLVHRGAGGGGPGSAGSSRSSESDQFSRAVAEVDRLVERCRGQELGPGEFVRSVVGVFLEYLAREDPRDDVSVLVEYCVDWARELSGLSLFADRVMVRDLEQQLEWCLERPLLRLRFDELVDGIATGLAGGDGQARLELVDLCRFGLETHPLLFSPVDWVNEVLVLAHRHGVSPALAAAVRPTSPARIAGPSRHGGRPYLLALDLLGALAADPLAEVDDRRLAQDQLIDLAGHVGVAADAAVRLPPHRLDRTQRDELLRAVGERVDGWESLVRGNLVCADAMREVEVVHTVLWQAADCEHART